MRGDIIGAEREIAGNLHTPCPACDRHIESGVQDTVDSDLHILPRSERDGAAHRRCLVRGRLRGDSDWTLGRCRLHLLQVGIQGVEQAVGSRIAADVLPVCVSCGRTDQLQADIAGCDGLV